MQGLNYTEQAKTIEEKLNQLGRNKIWDLVYKNNIHLSHQSLRKKLVYKLKHDVDSNITYFKAKWLVKGCFQQFEINFDQIFATIIKFIAFNIFFEIAAFVNLNID